jgi:hypothetical protein
VPQRTNPFQTLIALIERQLVRPGITVTESKLVRDEVIGETREVDVHLLVDDGQAPTTIGIECVDGDDGRTSPGWKVRFKSTGTLEPIVLFLFHGQVFRSQPRGRQNSTVR